ncbi:hypothetical protein FRC09_007302 [Ceratobasidium sp. 395]|nr:hypothetical protein FRC09_007302 [Ceratobasidium sp. 395]
MRAQQQLLLPRLSCILLQSPQGAHGDDQLIWIKTFSSPSLVEIRAITGNNLSPAYIPVIMADIILDTVTKCCPRLQKLFLFPLEDRSSQNLEVTDGLLGLLWRRPFHESLSRMSNLVELTGSLTILEKESLLAISFLPALRRLTVLGVYGPDVLEPQELSMDSFPALRELRLAGLVTYDQASVLGILPIMRHLTHLELECKIDDDDTDEDDPDEGDSIASELLPQLGNSPELLCLVLKFKHSRQDYKPCDIGGIALTEIFPELPLEQVILEGACISSWGYLTSACANVMSIQLSDQRAGIHELEMIARLPRLRYLRMSLDLSYVAGWVALLETSQSPLHTLESSAAGEIGVEPEELEDTAVVLLKLFPNLQELVWTPGSEAERAFVEILNQHIVLKREIEEMKMKIGVIRWDRLTPMQPV